MRYLLDEGWPPMFARRLYQQFYLGHSTDTVQHVSHLNFDGVDEGVWLPTLEQRAQEHNEQWVLVTRDKMKPHRREMFASPLIFAILVDKKWSNARSLELWQTLYRNWPLLQTHTALFCTGWPCLQSHAIPPAANVFNLSHDGKISDYQEAGVNN